MKRFIGVLLAIFLCGCASPSGKVTGLIAPSPEPIRTVTMPDITATLFQCQLDPVEQPPWPVQTLRPNEYDPETGLHMTGRPQYIDLAAYRLNVTGRVGHPLSLTYDQVRCLPRVTDHPELVCPGVFKDYATWTGVPVKVLVEMAGVQKEATLLTLVSADGYETKLPLELATADGNFLAYELKGKPLPVKHGFPLRAVFPTMPGAKWIKWIVELWVT